ncbi:HlyD family efflux transporter periplasmic adaptor subunit, partial [bacterium]|nr:HlyD family efflux transporter periplasmic adaptor subunit [bacterium]
MKSGILIVNHLLKIFFIVFIILFLIGVILISCFKLDITAHGTGIIKTKNWIDVKPEIEGIIKEMLIKENQKVNIGDILFTLENRERKVGVEAMKAKIDDLNNQISRLNQEISLMGNRIPLEIEEAKANLDAARAKYKVILSGAKTEELKLAENRINLSSLNLKKVSIDRRRLQEAFALKIVKKEDLENIYHREETCKIDLAMARQEKKALENKYDNNQIMAVKADVERFRAMYNRVVYRKKEPEILQQNLKSLIVAKAKEEKQMVVTLAQEGLTRVKAPMNGYVLTHDTKHLIGKAVKPGETILRLGDDNEFIVEAKISEVDFPLIKINQKAKVQIKPFPKGEYRLF